MNEAVNPEVLLHLDLLNGFESTRIGVLTMGIFYGLTLCSFSCLPIIGPYIFSNQAGFKQGFSATWIFVAAKVATYTMLGAISGASGSVVLEKIPPNLLLIGSGLIIIMVGILAWQRRGFCAVNLDSAVRSTHLTQPIDSPGKTGEDLITNKVIATSPVSPDKSIDYAMHALPTAESRFKAFQRQKTFHDTAFHPLRSRKSCSRKAEESV